MALLNIADAVSNGGTPAQRVYAGDALVWPPLTHEAVWWVDASQMSADRLTDLSGRSRDHEWSAEDVRSSPDDERDLEEMRTAYRVGYADGYADRTNGRGFRQMDRSVAYADRVRELRHKWTDE